MVRDEQTHMLPDNKEEMAVIAAMFGETNLKQFEARISKCLRKVESHYAALFEAEPGLSSVDGNLVFTGEDADPETLETLKRMGYERPGRHDQHRQGLAQGACSGATHQSGAGNC